MKIVIETIPHKWQRYCTIGDWYRDADGILQIKVSDMSDSKHDNSDYAFLVGLHEIVEAWLCEKRGISEESVTEFDKKYEMSRVPGDTSEPGDALDAPYHAEHRIATIIEMLMCAELRIPWQRYENDVEQVT